MQLGTAHRTSDATDVPTALHAAAASLGHRPAITLLSREGRQEQSYASLLQWAAKVAHWLEVDHGAGPQTTLGLAGPAGWVPAAAALGAWWAGCKVATGARCRSADVIVCHATIPDLDGHGEALSWGFEFDGTDADDHRQAFVHEVQPFPDTPPPATGGSGSAAMDDGTSQAALFAQWHDAPQVTAGIRGDDPAWLSAVAIRPLATGRPTVVLAGPGRDAADGDNVGTWL